MQNNLLLRLKKNKIENKFLSYLKNSYYDINIPQTSYNAPQLINLYNIPTITNTGTRQVKIAIIIAFHYPNLLSDLKSYWQNPINFGSKSNPPNVNIYSFTKKQNNGWATEECLDLQMICTINPNADIWVVEALSDSQNDMLNAVDYARQILQADVISMSWGSSDISNNIIFNNISDNSNNFISFCASSGDNNDVSWPATSSNCIAVGGTSLYWNPININNRIEYTWTSSGCGYSTSNKIPSYQNNINKTKYRCIPDLALIGNSNTGVNIVYKNKFITVGGSSVSCPIFAGILSLANQLRFNNNKTPLTTINNNNNLQNYLYKTIYTDNLKYTTCFNDIEKGTDGDYNAKTGFDIATGLGSPNATALCNELLNI